MLTSTTLPFKDRSEIESILQRVKGKQITDDLVKKLADLKQSRNAFYLNNSELEEILKWKLRGQYNRQFKMRTINNTNHNVETITKAAFAVKHDNIDIETELKIKILSTITGVATPVASAILTLCYPHLYAVIDFRNRRQAFSDESGKGNYTKEYNKYLSKIRKWAEEFGVTIQEMDIAIWQFDIEKNSKKKGN